MDWEFTLETNTNDWLAAKRALAESIEQWIPTIRRIEYCPLCDKVHIGEMAANDSKTVRIANEPRDRKLADKVAENLAENWNKPRWYRPGEGYGWNTVE